ncbi:MAG: hypothetical protein WAK31_17115 [Chthoniobacterales bacterium]|jgi:hypothetical protein
MRSWPLVVTIAAGSVVKSNFAGYFELFVMPTEDYPGPSKSQPEKEDKNDPPRPAGVDPVRPPMPKDREPPLPEEEGEE